MESLMLIGQRRFSGRQFHYLHLDIKNIMITGGGNSSSSIKCWRQNRGTPCLLHALLVSFKKHPDVHCWNSWLRWFNKTIFVFLHLLLVPLNVILSKFHIGVTVLPPPHWLSRESSGTSKQWPGGVLVISFCLCKEEGTISWLGAKI